MKLLKKTTIITTTLLATLICLSFLLPTFLTSKDNLATRNIDVDKIGTLSYEEKSQQLLNDFDVYSYNYSDSEITFDGEFTKDITDFVNYQQLSTIDESPITKKYSTKLNCEDQTFTLTTIYYQNEIIINQTKDSVVPIFDDKTNDYYIILDDGSKISVKESLQVESLESCVAIAATGALLAAALAITVVAAAPQIIQTVETVVTTIVSWVRSFWSWFRSLWKPRTRTVTTTVVTTVACPSITLGQTTYKTKSETIANLKNKNNYPQGRIYLCFVNGKNIYMSLVPLTEVHAVAVLAQGIVLKDPNSTSQKRGEMLASTFTQLRNDAYRIACTAGLSPRTPYERPDFEFGAFHYHTKVTKIVNGNERNPHSFFIS